MTDELHILTAYRAPERVVEGKCPMCERDRAIVFDITVARGGGEFEVLSVCDDCAPRASHLLAWLGARPV